MFSRLVISWLFLCAVDRSPRRRSTQGAGDADQQFYRGKLATARFYLNNELPYVHATAQILKSGERTALDFDEAWF